MYGHKNMHSTNKNDKHSASFSRAVFIQEIPRQHPTQSSFPWRVAEVKTLSGFYSTTPASRLLIYQHYYLRNDIFFIKTKCTRTQSVQTSAVLSPLRCDYFYNVRNVLHQLRERKLLPRLSLCKILR